MLNLGRLWRVVATGFCFVMFGVGGLGIAGAALPLLILIPGRHRRQSLTRELVHYSFRLHVALMRLTGAIGCVVHGKEKLARGGLLILANHPSLIDVVMLMSLVHRPDCIVKAALWRNPFTWGPVKLTGFISNASGPALVEAGIASVRSGNNLIIFPEGTRTVPGCLSVFQRGAANIASRGDLTITPVIITCSETFLTKGQPWYNVPRRKPIFELTVLDDLPPASQITGSDEPARQARRLTEYLTHYFYEEVEQHG
ncbi:MAG: lysophospholipid acyltransferase family protein [Formivibrio sp.]|nr:lysophospholipid acyltransferase family protein [Formivibrio sp.]